MLIKRLSLAAFVLVAVGMVGKFSATPVFAKDLGYAGYCVVSDTVKNAWTVRAKTLNEVKNFNNLYYEHWGRDAECEELQFQVDHRTSHDRLETWLEDTTDTRTHRWTLGTAGVDNLVTTIDGTNTVSITGAKFYFIQYGYTRRVYDFPTALSWGLNKDHRSSVDPNITSYLFERWPEGVPLEYDDGPFYIGIRDYRNGMDADNVPASITGALRAYLLEDLGPDLRGAMLWSGNFTTDRSMNLFDWSYLD